MIVYYIAGLYLALAHTKRVNKDPGVLTFILLPWIWPVLLFRYPITFYIVLVAYTAGFLIPEHSKLTQELLTYIAFFVGVSLEIEWRHTNDRNVSQ